MSLFTFPRLVSAHYNGFVPENAKPPFAGDGGLATSVAICPKGLAITDQGDVLFSDWRKQRLCKVDQKGKISTFAGNGSNGLNGDNGAAVRAELNNPFGITTDKLGNIYFIELGAAQFPEQIRKIDQLGIISTITPKDSTGSQLNGPIAISADGEGTLFLAEGFPPCVKMIVNSGITTILAKQPEVVRPAGLFAAKKNMTYIADAGSNCVRRLDGAGNMITVAGTGAGYPGFSGDGGAATEAQLNCPRSIALDRTGRLFIADTLNNRIRMVDQTGNIITIAGTGKTGHRGLGGPAKLAELFLPTDLNFDHDGNLFFIVSGANADFGQVLKIDVTGKLSAVAGNAMGWTR